jgi:hypothetical protein
MHAVMAKASAYQPLQGLEDRDLDVDVAVGRLGIRANTVRRINELLREVPVDVGYADVETRSQKEGIIGRDQVNLGINRRMGRQRYFLSRGGKLDCAHKAGRPGGGKKLFRGRMRMGQLDVETAIGAAREPVVAAGGMGLASEENRLSHTKTFPILF